MGWSIGQSVTQCDFTLKGDLACNTAPALPPSLCLLLDALQNLRELEQRDENKIVTLKEYLDGLEEVRKAIPYLLTL